MSRPPPPPPPSQIQDGIPDSYICVYSYIPKVNFACALKPT